MCELGYWHISVAECEGLKTHSKSVVVIIPPPCRTEVGLPERYLLLIINFMVSASLNSFLVEK